MSLKCELTIYGSKADIHLFINDHCTNNVWSIPDCSKIEGSDMDIDSGIYDLEFYSDLSYITNEWLRNVRKKYSSLKFALFWYGEDTVPHLGFNDPDGEEFVIYDKSDLKEACDLVKERDKMKLLMKGCLGMPKFPAVPNFAENSEVSGKDYENHTKAIISQDSMMEECSDVITAQEVPDYNWILNNAIPLGFGLYKTNIHDFLIGRNEQSGRLYCIGVGDLRTGYRELTVGEIEICNKHGIRCNN